MQGLRTQESDKFNKFWLLIQEQAAKKGMVFFGDCGEGNDFETEDMEGENFCGWLIPQDKVKEFEPNWKDDNVADEWSDNMTWVEWKKEKGKVSIEFNNY
jgi:hypothetical protein